MSADSNETESEESEPTEGDALAQAEAILEDAASTEEEAAGALAEAEKKAAEHLDDLQRLQAEYVNYRKRVDRDRDQVAELSVAKTVEALIPVLDDVVAARGHEELTGPFAAIADKLEAALGKLGWSSFGTTGEEFDPAIHEALATTTDAEATTATIAEVAQPGHRLGERILRPARVIVTQPE